MLNAHNELYKFADCLNININKKPIPSKHVNTSIVYSYDTNGENWEEKNSWKRHKREDLTRLGDLMELSKQWFQFISKHSKHFLSLGFENILAAFQIAILLLPWKIIIIGFSICYRFIDYWKKTQCCIYTTHWFDHQMVNEILLNGDINFLFNNENDLTFDTFTVFHFIALKLIFLW